MTRSYSNAVAFRQALEGRLRTAAQQRSVAIQGIRLKVAIERLLARLFSSPAAPWLLKGGYAMELRFRPRARTTRDVDLTIGDTADERAVGSRLEEVHESLQVAAAQNLGDFFEFVIQPARSDLQGIAGGVFPVVARMASRDFARFHIDVGLGDPTIGEPEALEGDDLLAFAGVPPARAFAIPRAQQFAEKIHAYTHPWTDRQNTRSRDLVDLVLLIERGRLGLDAVREAIHRTFARRAKQPLPDELPPPPEAWAGEFPDMAAEAGIAPTTILEAFGVLDAFWNQVSIRGHPPTAST